MELVSYELVGGWPTTVRLKDSDQCCIVHTFLRKFLCEPINGKLHLYSYIKGLLTSKERDPNELPKAFRPCWTSGTDSQRAGGLIWLDKQPLSTRFLEREMKATGDGYKNLFQRPSKSQFLPSRTLSIPFCHHFILSSLSAPFWGGGGSYLTLICSVVSFREMTCNSRGKGQLFLFPSFESQFPAP